MSDNNELVTLAATVLATCRTRGWMLATAESCTGGMVASALTAVAGSSDVVERGFVTYSNEAKVEMLGVAPTLIAEHGAVSWQVAEAMARGALENARAQVSVAITGIAGPGGGSNAKPVGLVFLALAITGGGTQHIERSYGPLGREAIRQAAATDALQLVLEAAGRA